MERPFDDAAMLHFIRDSLFRTDSPLHHEFSIPLERFIAERIASRESEWFPCLSCDLHSCSQKLADTQAKVIQLEQHINALQTTAASATAATDYQVLDGVKKVPTRTGSCCTPSTISCHFYGLASHQILHDLALSCTISDKYSKIWLLHTNPDPLQ